MPRTFIRGFTVFNITSLRATNMNLWCKSLLLSSYLQLLNVNRKARKMLLSWRGSRKRTTRKTHLKRKRRREKLMKKTTPRWRRAKTQKKLPMKLLQILLKRIRKAQTAERFHVISSLPSLFILTSWWHATLVLLRDLPHPIRWIFPFPIKLLILEKLGDLYPEP